MIGKSNAGGGAKVTIDGVKVTEDLNLETNYLHRKIGVANPFNLSADSGKNSIPIWNGEPYLTYGRTIYKWNGTEWIAVTTIPAAYTFFQNSLCIFQDELYVLGRNVSNQSEKTTITILKYNGATWTTVCNSYTFDFIMYSCWVLAFDNELHLLGCNYNALNAHYKFNGTSIEKASTLPMDGCTSAYFAVYNSEIHLLFPYEYSRHYKWNGTEWTKLNDPPIL